MGSENCLSVRGTRAGARTRGADGLQKACFYAWEGTLNGVLQAEPVQVELESSSLHSTIESYLQGRGT